MSKVRTVMHARLNREQLQTTRHNVGRPWGRPGPLADGRGSFCAILAALCALLACVGFVDAADAQQVFGDVQCVDMVSTADRVDMLVGKPVDDAGNCGFFHQQSNDGGATWSDAVRVDPVDGEPIAKHGRGHDARLAVDGDALTVVWTLNADGPMGSGPLATAYSTDGGKSWRQGASPSGDASATGARFPAIVASGDAVHVVWIHAVGRERALRASTSTDHGRTWSQPTVVDPVICACCWNTLRVDANGKVYALYRNHDRSDMHLAVRDVDGQWQLKGAVGAFEWQFEGCPHVGGGLSIVPGKGDAPPTLVATVWTGEPSAMGAYVTQSADGASTWTRPAPLVDQGMWKGQRTDVATSAGHTLMAFDNVEQNHSRVFVRTLRADGSMGPTIALSDAGRSATHPRVIATTDGWLIAWTQTSDDGQSLDLVLHTMTAASTKQSHVPPIPNVLTLPASDNTLSICESCSCATSGS